MHLSKRKFVDHFVKMVLVYMGFKGFRTDFLGQSVVICFEMVFPGRRIDRYILIWIFLKVF